MSSVIALILIVAAVLFILGIQFLSSPKTARTGNLIAAAGMLVALIVLCKPDGSIIWGHIWSFNHTLIVIGTVVGLVIGAMGAYSVKMTSMPQMVALFNGLGGGAAALVASLEFLKPAHGDKLKQVVGGADASAGSLLLASAMLFATLIGSLSFSGSIIAYLKLEGEM